MKWAIILAFCLSLIAGPADGRLNTPVDESRPELVKQYIFFPCDALVDSYAFMYSELTHITGRIIQCQEMSADTDYKYADLMCLYVEMQWQYVYEHAMSMKKAYELVCDDAGYEKNPKYEIDF